MEFVRRQAQLHIPLQNRSTLLVFSFVLGLASIQVPLAWALKRDDNGFPWTPALTYQEVLEFHNRNDDNIPGNVQELTVLGFVTPWNAGGKDVAILQASRGHLDDVSPVTWQMLPSGLTGGQDFEDSFYTELSKAGSRIYPRILFEAQAWATDDFRKLSEDPTPMVERIIQMCSKGGFEGVVLEIWQSLMGLGAFRGKGKHIFINLVVALGEGIRKDAGLRTVLVLPPYSNPEMGGGVEPMDIERLQIAFNFFVVMTYDFSTPGSRPGPMAPISWVKAVGTYMAKDCGLGRKVLIGLNFYGLDFMERSQGQAPNDRHIVGHEYISLLREHRPAIVWLDDVGEHAFTYYTDNRQHVVFYPTRQSIAQRVSLVNELGCGGVAIWELGQGLKYFFDEL